MFIFLGLGYLTQNDFSSSILLHVNVKISLILPLSNTLMCKYATSEYYSAEKNEILTFACKMDGTRKKRILSLYFMILEKLSNKVNPKKT